MALLHVPVKMRVTYVEQEFVRATVLAALEHVIPEEDFFAVMVQPQHALF